MTMQQLKERVNFQWSGYGTYIVEITYRGKKYRCISHNSIARDDYQSDNKTHYKTDKQCLQAYYDECKRKNNLNFSER